jgi:hypothetical protein
MSDAVNTLHWPQATLDPVRRLHVLAAGLGHVGLSEAVFDVPFDRIWGLVGDLESGVPRFEHAVQSSEIVARDGSNLALRVRSPLGVPMHFDVELEPGWCLMQSRIGLVGMAAVPEADGRHTRFAHFEGAKFASRLLRPFFQWNVRGDLDRIAALCDARILDRRG